MKRVLVKSLLISATLASLVYFYLVLPNVSLLKNRNPQTSALMELRDQENREKKLRLSRQRIWVPYGQISDHLKKAVLLSERRFFLQSQRSGLRRAQGSIQKRSKNAQFQTRRRAEAGSRHYFGKSAASLDPLEAATLVALLPSPRATREKSILQRRNLVLARLAKVGHISEEEYHRAKEVPLFYTAKKDTPRLLQD